jgi:hypothetical protein
MTSAIATASERSHGLSSCISGLTGAEAATVTFTLRVRVKPRASVSYLPRPEPWQTRRGPGAALNRAAAPGPH